VGYRLAVDVGGTFTDYVLENLATGQRRFFKVLTTPRDLAGGILSGLQVLAEREKVELDEIAFLLHATTVAVNAIIERRGAPTGVITTRGFRDVLFIGRQKRYDTYDLTVDKIPPLIPRRWVVEVTERINCQGQVLTPIDIDEARSAIQTLLQQGIISIAICLLHSYANPSHEQKLAALVHEMAPHVAVSTSCEVAAKYREYERFSTTVANAFVKPVFARYLRDLTNRSRERGLRGTIAIMQSSGGMIDPTLAAEFPVRVIESGPAAGAYMAGMVARECGLDSVLAFDMGGTTAKVCLITQGEPLIGDTLEVAGLRGKRGSGFPLLVPGVDLVEIGAGGGSIATVRGGVLHVGPESAGADPGPACYERGGAEPTVTDANLLLGYLNPHYFLGGEMTLSEAHARRAIARVAQALGVDLAGAAWGVFEVANASMERAIRVMSIERGYDPRKLSLIAYGGAGPIHAVFLARSLRIPRVVIPAGAGVGSAIGILTADWRVDVGRTHVLSINTTPFCIELMAQIFNELEREALTQLRQVGLPAQHALVRRRVYARYRGQGFEVRVDLTRSTVDENYLTDLVNRFQQAYSQRYGNILPSREVEVVDWLVTATVPNPRPSRTVPTEATKPLGAPARVSQRPITVGRGRTEAAKVYRRDELSPGTNVIGPCVIEERESTTVLFPGDRATITPHGHLFIEVGGEGS
jgi:N-methylhydantoinase A/oxoprolinase/acetone carboxylase beta subunit